MAQAAQEETERAREAKKAQASAEGRSAALPPAAESADAGAAMRAMRAMRAASHGRAARDAAAPSAPDPGRSAPADPGKFAPAGPGRPAPYGAGGAESPASAGADESGAFGPDADDGDDPDATVNVRRPVGPFLRPDRSVAGSPGTWSPTPGPAGLRPPPGAPGGSNPGDHGPAAPGVSGLPGGPGAPGTWSPSPPASSAAPRRNRQPRWLSAAILRVGDIPIRAVYGIGAAIVTGIIVVLIFMLFGGEKTGDPVRVDAQAGGTAASSAAPTPAPPPIAVPPVPAARAMTVFDGPGTPIAAYVVDQKARLSYAQYGAPWAKTTRAPFSKAQKAGPGRQPQAFIGSGPVPVAVPASLATYADYRKLAAKAAKWSLRYQPTGSKFAWTVSQQARYNLGWLLGYKVTYVRDGRKHSSQAYVMVVSTSVAKKPAFLFANVPDTRKPLLRDLNMLFWTARAT